MNNPQVMERIPSASVTSDRETATNESHDDDQ